MKRRSYRKSTPATTKQQWRQFENLSAPTSAELQAVGLIRESKKLVEDIQGSAPSGGGFVLSPSIGSTAFPASRGMTSSPKETPMEPPHTPSPSQRTSRIASVFPNLQRHATTTAAEQAPQTAAEAERLLHDQFGSPIPEEEVMPPPKTAADPLLKSISRSRSAKPPPKSPSPQPAVRGLNVRMRTKGKILPPIRDMHIARRS